MDLKLAIYLLFRAFSDPGMADTQDSDVKAQMTQFFQFDTINNVVAPEEPNRTLRISPKILQFISEQGEVRTG
jgi:hypothetical protein